jgi:hypothetical protein
MEETDHEELSSQLESQGDDMEERRDELEGEAQAARQDVKSKVGDQRVPGVQDEQEDVIHGREAVEEDEQGAEGDARDEGDEEEQDSEEVNGSEEDGEESDEGGSEGAGYREDEE